MDQLQQLRFDYTPEEITTRVDQLIEQSQVAYDQIAEVPVEEATYDNIVRAMTLADTQAGQEMNIISFLQHVSGDEKVREASRQAETRWSEFQIKSAQREDHYQRFLRVQSSTNNAPTDPQDFRVLDHSLRGYRRIGMGLDADKREQLRQMLNRQQELGVEFQKNTGEDQSSITLKSEQLSGVAPDFLERTSIKDESSGKCTDEHKITAKYPDVFPIFQFCDQAKTRQRVMEMFESRCQENFPILVELTKLRQEMADLLGYKTIADFRVEVNMSKTPQRVRDLLSEVLEKLAPGTRAYVETLSELKASGGNDDNCNSSSQLEYWDYAYYHQLYLKQQHQLDHQKLREYFPADHVVAEMLRIYSEIFGLTFHQMDPPSPAASWHSQSEFFQVRDSGDPELVLGHFYMDLYPRDGKFTHAAMWDLISGSQDAQGNQTKPVAALLCNFSPPTKEQPSLLMHGEVNTLFHEFGHVIHGICGGYRAKYSEMAGTSVETDFVEAPSQMIEQWLWEPQVLQRLAKHYQTGQSIPTELLDSLLASRFAGKARDWTRQAVLALTDQILHSQGEWTPETMMSTFQEISDKYMGYSCGTGKSLASWGHLAGGYDAKYYSYVWSRVIAADLYSRFTESGNPLDPEIGMEYRQKILEPGGSLDGDQMVRNYLGRDSRIEPFLATMGC